MFNFIKYLPGAHFFFLYAKADRRADKPPDGIEVTTAYNTWCADTMIFLCFGLILEKQNAYGSSLVCPFVTTLVGAKLSTARSDDEQDRMDTGQGSIIYFHSL